MTDPSAQAETPKVPSEAAKKYKTIARAIIANDVDACRELFTLFKESGKTMSDDDIQSLGMRWFVNKSRPVEMVPFLHEIGFDFTQYVILDQETENSGTRIPFRLIGNEPNEKVLLRLIDDKIIQPDLTDGMGDSLLIEAVQRGRYDFAKELIARGVDINMTNIGGQGALHIFAGRLNFQAVQWLGEVGADPTIEDLQGARPSELVPEIMEGWNPNAMYDVLEDYVDKFRANKPFEVNPEFTEMAEKEKGEQSPEDDQTVGDQADQAKSILTGLGI